MKSSCMDYQINAVLLYCASPTFLYRVFLKKVLHKREEKMQEKMKMTWQKDKIWCKDSLTPPHAEGLLPY